MINSRYILYDVQSNVRALFWWSGTKRLYTVFILDYDAVRILIFCSISVFSCLQAGDPVYSLCSVARNVLHHKYSIHWNLKWPSNSPGRRRVGSSLRLCIGSCVYYTLFLCSYTISTVHALFFWPCVYCTVHYSSGHVSTVHSLLAMCLLYIILLVMYLVYIILLVMCLLYCTLFFWSCI
jgi:hypothetical protein